MEDREPVDAEVAGLRAEAVALAGEAKRLQDAIAEGEAAIDAELAAESDARSAEASAIPEDVLRAYERLRAKLGGVGIARIAGSSCTGCHLTLPATELAHIRHEPEDALIFCDHCGRILVR